MKYIIKHPNGDVYAPYGNQVFADVFSNADTFTHNEAIHKADKLKEEYDLPYIQIIEIR